MKKTNFKPRNALAVAPMSTSKAVNGMPNSFHIQHYGAQAFGGFGTVVVEATGVLPEGRIENNSIGIYDQKSLPVWKNIVQAIHTNGAKAVIQLVHAGNKCATDDKIIYSVMGTAFGDNHKEIRKIDQNYLLKIRKAFVDGARLAYQAGFDAIELHAAHGYLLSEFFSIVTNPRKDGYGSDYEGRSRLIREIVEDIQKEVPINIAIRVSAYEWETVNTPITDFSRLANDLPDLIYISVSTGGLTNTAKIEVKPFFQLPFALEIKKNTSVPVVSAGGYKDRNSIDYVLNQGIDYVAVGRASLLDPYLPYRLNYIKVTEMGPQKDIRIDSYFNKILQKGKP